MLIGGALLVLFMKTVLIVTEYIWTGVQCLHLYIFPEVIFVCSGLITRFYSDKGEYGTEYLRGFNKLNVVSFCSYYRWPRKIMKIHGFGEVSLYYLQFMK